MSNQKHPSLAFAAAAALFAAASCAATSIPPSHGNHRVNGQKSGPGGSEVVVNGGARITDVRVIDGRFYISVSDLARAMEMLVVRSGNRYILTSSAPRSSASTASAASKVRNKLGEFTGPMNADVSSSSWSLRVLSAQQVAAYTDQFGPGTDSVALKQAGDVLVAVRCRLKNRTNATQEVYFDRSTAGNTSLTDHSQHAYGPSVFDSRNSDYSTNKMLAGTTQEFTIVFSVPRGTQMKDLVFTVATSGGDKTTDFRIALAP